jgi:general stress protein CsbA
MHLHFVVSLEKHKCLFSPTTTNAHDSLTLLKLLKSLSLLREYFDSTFLLQKQSHSVTIVVMALAAMPAKMHSRPTSMADTTTLFGVQTSPCYLSTYASKLSTAFVITVGRGQRPKHQKVRL